MARLERNEVDYFPFICKDGKAEYYITQKYGNDGFATWVRILKLLATTNYHHLDLSSRFEMMHVPSKCGVSEELFLQIVDDLVDLGEFDSKMWSEYKVIWSDKFIDSIQEAYRKRKNECYSKAELYRKYGAILPESSGVLSQSSAVIDLSSGRNTQSKVKESKVKESKVKERKVKERKEEESKNYILVGDQKIYNLDDYMTSKFNIFYDQLRSNHPDKKMGDVCKSFVDQKTQVKFSDENHIRNALNVFVRKFKVSSSKESIPSFQDSGFDSISEYRKNYNL